MFNVNQLQYFMSLYTSLNVSKIIKHLLIF